MWDGEGERKGYKRKIYQEASSKQGEYLQGIFPALSISIVTTLEEADINSLWVENDSTIFLELLKNREIFSFSTELEPAEEAPKAVSKSSYELDTLNPNNLVLTTKCKVILNQS